MDNSLIIVIGTVCMGVICLLGVAIGGILSAYMSRGQEIEEIQSKHRSERTDRIRHEIHKGFKKKIELPEDSFEKFFEKIEKGKEAEHVKNKYLKNKQANVRALVSRGMSR